MRDNGHGRASLGDSVKGSIGERLKELLDRAGFDHGDGLPGIFIEFVDFLVRHPNPNLPFAVGEVGASGETGALFWSYHPQAGLHLVAKAGFLATATGNGGFTLDVRPDGSWRLDFAGSPVRIGAGRGEGRPGEDTPPPPAGNTVVGIENGARVVYDGSAGNLTVDGTLPAPGAANPVAGNDTIFAGVRDYLIGGSAPHVVGAPGDPGGNVGNCAIYTAANQSSVPPGSVLVDMENGRGYGSNAEGNVFVNIDQVRGSLASNVLIGASTGSDLKSGGDGSVLISTGGSDYELRPDGDGNLLVSTIGKDRVLFDPNRGAWQPGDHTDMLGFRAGNLAYLDLSLLHSNFHDPSAAGYDPVTGMGDIDDYVKLVDGAEGEKVLFSATGQVNVSFVELIDLKLTHGLTAQGLFDQGGIVI